MIWGSSNSVIVAVATTTVSCCEDGTCSLIIQPPKKLLLPTLPSWKFCRTWRGEIGLSAKPWEINISMHAVHLLALLVYHHVLNTHCWVIILVLESNQNVSQTLNFSRQNSFFKKLEKFHLKCLKCIPFLIPRSLNFHAKNELCQFLLNSKSLNFQAKNELT